MEKDTSGFTASFLKVPQGVNTYKIKVGKALLDIIPYVVGAGNPNADEGMLWWERTFWVHRGIGPNQVMVICPAKTREKPCPICEARQRLLRNGDEESRSEADDLKPKEQALVQIRDRNDKDKGIQLFPLSFHRFLDKVHEMANAEEAFQNFWHPKGGKALKVVWGEDSTGDKGGKYTRAKTVLFTERQDLPDAVIDKGYCLDSLLLVYKYEKLEELFNQGAHEEVPPAEEEAVEGEETEEAATEEEVVEEGAEETPEAEEPPPRKKPVSGKSVPKRPAPPVEEEDTEGEEPVEGEESAEGEEEPAAEEEAVEGEDTGEEEAPASPPKKKPVTVAGKPAAKPVPGKKPAAAKPTNWDAFDQGEPEAAAEEGEEEPAAEEEEEQPAPPPKKKPVAPVPAKKPVAGKPVVKKK